MTSQSKSSKNQSSPHLKQSCTKSHFHDWYSIISNRPSKMAFVHRKKHQDAYVILTLRYHRVISQTSDLHNQLPTVDVLSLLMLLWHSCLDSTNGSRW